MKLYELRNTGFNFTKTGLYGIFDIYRKAVIMFKLEAMQDINHRKSDFNQNEIDMAPSKKNTLKKKAVKKNKTKPAKNINKTQSETTNNCEDNDFSTQTEQSKQAVHQNDTQDNSSPLSVAITCVETGILWKEESELILTAIQKQITSEANATNPDTTRTTFNSEPLFEEGVLKLWCGNDHTLAWLKNTVSGLHLPSISLVVKSQLEIQKRIRFAFKFLNEQEVFDDYTDLGRVVWYQNPWVDVHRWELFYWEKCDNVTWFIIIDAPEDQIPTLLKAGRRLSIGLMSVYILFEGPDGKFNSEVPQGWDAATETIVKKPTTSKESKKVPLQTVHPFVILTGEQEDYLHEKHKNNVGT